MRADSLLLKSWHPSSYAIRQIQEKLMLSIGKKVSIPYMGADLKTVWKVA